LARIYSSEESQKEKLQSASAWHDAQSGKSALIHHEVAEDCAIGSANVRACLLGIAALNGAHGETTIPDSDRDGAYRHLAAHLRDAHMQAPELKSTKTIEHKIEVPLMLKGIEEDGTFSGWLSVYDVLDAGGDVVEQGAYSKTLTESGGKFPLLWQHKSDSPIGVINAEDKAEGLWVKGSLNLDVTQAREAYSTMKFLSAAGLRMGMSIGYIVVKDSIEKGIRKLKELKLLEGSLVTLPMNRLAYVSEVKAINGADVSMKDFTSELETIQSWALYYQMQQALWSALEAEVGYYSDSAREARLANISMVLEQFTAAFLDYAPRLLDLRGVKDAGGLASKQFDLAETAKARIKQFISQLSALCGEARGTSDDEAAAVSTGAAISSADIEALKDFRLFGDS
jgi:hypothetical protein